MKTMNAAIGNAVMKPIQVSSSKVPIRSKVPVAAVNSGNTVTIEVENDSFLVDLAYSPYIVIAKPAQQATKRKKKLLISFHIENSIITSSPTFLDTHGQEL